MHDNTPSASDQVRSELIYAKTGTAVQTLSHDAPMETFRRHLPNVAVFVVCVPSWFRRKSGPKRILQSVSSCVPYGKPAKISHRNIPDPTKCLQVAGFDWRVRGALWWTLYHAVRRCYCDVRLLLLGPSLALFLYWHGQIVLTCVRFTVVYLSRSL